MENAQLLGSTMLARYGAIIAMAAEADERLQALKDEVVALTDERDGIIAHADEAGEDLTDDELDKVKALNDRIQAKQKQVDARASAAASRQSAGRRATPEPTTPQPSVSVQAVQSRIPGTRGGYKSFGEFAVAVRRGSAPGAVLDQRLQAAATTYGNEGTGADGGFAVPQEFRAAIWQKVLSDDNLLMRCDRLVTGSNNMTIPKDETTPWQTSGGVLAYWESEGGAATQSKLALETANIRLNKLMALVPMTDELMEDAPGLDSYLRAKAPAKMMAKINTAIIRGTGVGQPLGILNAGSLITQAAESGPQTADTVWYINIVKMWSRLYGPCRRNAIWLINQDIEPQLNVMAFDAGATDKFPAYLPAGGASASPYATLMGRPVVPVEACSTLGDVGDIILVDLSQYMALTKGNDIQTDVSMHLYFDQGMQAYRFTFRVTGQPWWGSTISPQFGTATRSWAVALAAR